MCVLKDFNQNFNISLSNMIDVKNYIIKCKSIIASEVSGYRARFWHKRTRFEGSCKPICCIILCLTRFHMTHQHYASEEDAFQPVMVDTHMVGIDKTWHGYSI